MTAKEYLTQAYRIDQRINSKLEQVASLRDLSTKATSTFSDVPPSGTRDVHRMEDVICKIIMLENEINAEIDHLVDLKREIREVISAVKNLECQTLLELRYLCFKTWEQIAVQMNYSMLYIEESIVTAISENPPQTAADFEERIQRAVEADCIRGFRIADGKATLSTPFVQDEPTRWTAYADLFKGILKTAETASRISIKRLDDSENEKYHANSWLMRMGFGGADYKETRRILMGRLTGFAAFKSAADMEAHKERQAQRLREKREGAQE